MARPPKKPALTAKQRRFVDEYLKDLNATQAARRAGYAYPDKQGSRLLVFVGVREAVQAGLAAQRDEVRVEAATVLRELLRIATTDIGEAFDINGDMKKLHEMPVELRRAVSGIEVEELFEGAGDGRMKIGQTKKVKLWDKTKALELLGKHLKLFTEKLEVEGKVSLEQMVLASYGKKKGET